MLAVCALGFGAYTLAGVPESDPSSADAFVDWINADQKRQKEYAAFVAFLRERNVSDVVSPWQLTRVDAQHAKSCDTEFFNIPPQDRWVQIVPTLRFLRDHVIPVTGRLQVVSGWRSPETNACVNGAKRSKHLQFRALDLIAPDRADRHDLYRELCALQRRKGASENMGLGAYYDPSDTERNTAGRFHIDVSGNRSWGFDYTSKSSPCPELL